MISVGDVVTTKHDQVRVFGHERLDRVCNVLVGDKSAAMKIGEESDPKSSQCGRPPIDRNRCASDLELVAAVEEPVRASAGQRPDARRDDRSKDRTASDGHRLV